MELFLGMIAGAVTQTLTLPISVLTTRQQTSNPQKSVVALVTDIVQKEGLQGLYKGFKASLVLTVNPAITYGYCSLSQGCLRS